jgi:hypothetical protein
MVHVMCRGLNTGFGKACAAVGGAGVQAVPPARQAHKQGMQVPHPAANLQHNAAAYRAPTSTPCICEAPARHPPSYGSCGGVVGPAGCCHQE